MFRLVSDICILSRTLPSLWKRASGTVKCASINGFKCVRFDLVGAADQKEHAHISTKKSEQSVCRMLYCCVVTYTHPAG